MRTTFDIADDVLAAAKAIARERGISTGAVVSELARQGLRRPGSPSVRNGVPLLQTRRQDTPVTLDLVNALRDEAP